MSAISPALTASSSTTAFNSHHSSTAPYDFDSEMTMDKLGDFSDIFNFDQYDCDESNQSHSPQTISPNHTPSPVHGAVSPVAVSPSYDFLNLSPEMSFNDPLKSERRGSSSRSSVSGDVTVKQEPVEFGFPMDPSTSQSPPAPVQPQLQSAAPAPDFSALPADQQLALQQLLTNMINYQQQYGLDLQQSAQPQMQQQAQQQQQQQQEQQQPQLSGTIQPSMLFNTPANEHSSASTSVSVSPVDLIKTSPGQSQENLLDMDDEPLVAVEPHEQPARQKKRSASNSSNLSDLDAKIDSLVPLPAIFSAGRGKGGKKGGGLSSVVRGDDEEIDEEDNWRPSPEEYKKLSSKEKRQLRNKLSARAFRTRRKDYIGTLESHIKDRDIVIDAIRTELVSSKAENQDLRRELEALKKSTMSILHPESAVSTAVPPALLSTFTMGPSLPNAVAGPSSQPATVPAPAPVRRSVTPKVNTRKDLPLSPSALDSSRGFWGGQNDLLGGGSTICHTLFAPDLVLPENQASTSSSSSSSTSPLRSLYDLPRVNINPLLNEDHSPNKAAPMPHLGGAAKHDDLQNTFSEWSETNPFTLRSMDSYRMQIWSRLAREAAAEKTSMPVDIRPKFYAASSSDPSSSSSYMPSPAQLATTATTHITSKLASSFWSAFTSPSSSSRSSGRESLDTDKLAAVVTGQARLKVVATTTSSKGVGNDDTDNLIASMSGLKLQPGLGLDNGSHSSYGLRTRENPLAALTSLFFKSTTPMATR